tara:strand:- start:635 stop:1228 length:594 start_codon:yes stop_codon:yes gene_type:complete
MKIKVKEDKKSQILDAAFSMFVEKGYSETTMDDIVNASNMSKGAIYHYYNSKKDLFLSLIDHWETYSFPDFYSKGNKDKKASEILMDLSDIVLNVFNNKKHVFLAEVEFWALSNRDGDVKEKSRLLYNKLLYLFELVLKKGIREKEFNDMDTKVVAMTILTSLQGINWFCLYEDSHVTAEDYIKTSMQLLIRSLKRR